MLAFFRKIRKSLIESGSARRYLFYALGEIALVVIGILVALQVNNWNEWRKDRFREQEIIENVYENITLNIELLKSNLAFLDNLNRSTTIIEQIIINKKPYSDSLSIHFSNARKHGFLNFMLSKSGYEAYKNAGFDLVLNKQLKDKIIDLFEAILPRLERAYNFVESESELTRILVFDSFYMINNDSLFPKDYRGLLSDKKYLSLFRRIGENRFLLKERIEDSIKESEKVLHLIKHELGEDQIK